MKKVLTLASVLLGVTLLFGQGSYECLDCHEQEGLVKAVTDTTEKSMYVDIHTIENSVHVDLACVDCHQNTSGHPDENALPEVNCANCHDDAMEDFALSVHGLPPTDENIPGATCKNCHGTHDIKASDDKESKVYPLNLAETCDACHSKPEVLQLLGKKGAGPSHTYLSGAHGQLKQNDPDGKAPTCTDCHDYHKILPRRNSESNFSKNKISETCGTCHEQEQKEYEQSIHFKAIQRGHYDAPTCNDCHSEHAVSADLAQAEGSPHLSHDTKVCKDCHSSEVLMSRYGLDHRRFDSYLKSYHGLAAVKGSPDAATCTACHETHSIRSSTDTLSSVHVSNLQGTCGQCHENISPEFAQIEMHPMDQETRNPIAFFFKQIYFWMILIVIGGMLGHNILILVHHVREKRKKELGQVRVTRFQSFEVYQHLVMLTSFLTLAVTGFALKFPDAGWVNLLVSMGMTEFIRSTIHRVAAVGLAVTSLIQLFYFIFSHKGRKDFLSLLPTVDDLVHVWQNIRLNLGLSKEKPKYGRYDYGEKAEYLALIWGNLVMGATGFILWFPEIFIGYIPFWAFETSEVIHYYEAWLAILAIIVWHWFFVFIHPDNAPVNLTFMDGKITEENLKHHHPAEYERLKAEQKEQQKED